MSLQFNPITCLFKALLNNVSVLAILVAVSTSHSLFAQDKSAADPANNWANFRGPTFNGTSETATPPSEWSEDKNVKWKIDLPGSGNNSSPIVWENKVIVLTAIPQPAAAGGGAGEAQSEEQRPRRGGGRRGGGRRRGAPLTPTKFVTLCYDRNTGEKLWEQLAVETTPHQGVHPDHSFASASPITDGKHIYSHFGSRGLYCYDMDGKLKWKRDDFGKMMTRNGFGEGSSPFLHKETIVVPWDHEGDSYVMALNALTGETLWKKERDEPSNWVTPLVVNHDGKDIVVTGGANMARGYDLADGTELWKASGFTTRPVSAPVTKDGMVYLASSRGGAVLTAVNLNGEGSLNGTDSLVWRNDKFAPDVPSMMLSGERLFHMRDSRNVLCCVNPATGKNVFDPVRLDGIRGVYSSLVAAGGKVIIVGRSGTAVVIEDGNEYKVLATNKLDDLIDATPALAGKQIFLRGKKHLYCIEASE